MPGALPAHDGQNSTANSQGAEKVRFKLGF